MSLKTEKISRPPEIPNPMQPLWAILNAAHPGAWKTVGGMPLAARALFHIKQMGIKKIVLLLSTDSPTVDLGKWQKNLDVSYQTLKGDVPITMLSVAGFNQPFLYLDTTHLMDPRILYALASAAETTLAYMDSADRNRQVVRAGVLTADDLRIWAQRGNAGLIQKAGSLFPEDLDPFLPELRGFRHPYFIQVRSTEEAREATRTLIKNHQKQVLDLPAEFVHPFFEDALTRILCDSPVTPNMVTFAGTAIAVGAASLFWHGHFVLGAFIVLIVDILDGVDGKLARTKLQFSKIGEHEDLIDYFYETSWYVALGVGIGNTVSTHWPAVAAGLLILSDTADNIFYTLAGKWHGKSIDLFHPFDSAFRRIAGRRNIYGFMFIIGFSLGFPLITFFAAAAWAALTAGIHGFRLVQFGKHMKKNQNRVS